MAYETLSGDTVRAKSSEEITEELKQLRDKLYTLRIQAVTEKVEDNSLFRKVRGDVARLLTEQTSRRRAAAAERLAG